MRFFDTRQAAEDFLGEAVRESRQRTRPLLAATTTVAQYAEHWLAQVAPGLKPRTIESYTETLRRHALPALGSLQVRQLHRSRVKALLAAKRDGGLSANSVRIILAVLRAMLNAAVDDGLLVANPSNRLGKALRLTISKATRAEIIKAMTPDQLGRFLTTAVREQPRLSPLWLFQARTGVRPGEAYAVRWDDLDLAAREARISRALSDDGNRIDTPKSGHGRTVDLSHQLVEALRRLHVERKAETLRRGWRELPPWVFPSTTGGLLDAHNVRRGFGKTLKVADLPGHFTPHCLRHTYASILLVNGESPYYVQRQLGHASIQLTVDTYGRWLPAGNKAAVDRLDQPLGAQVVTQW